MRETVTLTNETGGDVSVNSISTTAPFSVVGNNCPSTLGDTQSCTIDVTFSPSSKQSSAEDLEISTNRPNSPRTVSLTGTGVIGVAVTGGGPEGLGRTFSATPGQADQPTGVVRLTPTQSGADLTEATVTLETTGASGVERAALWLSANDRFEAGGDTELVELVLDPSTLLSTLTFEGFAVKESETATVTLYNTLGQRVATPYEGHPTLGEQVFLRLDASTLSSGAYWVRLKTGNAVKTRKMTVVK